MSAIDKSKAAYLCEKALEVYSSFNARLVVAIELWQEALLVDPDCDEAKLRLAYALEEQQGILDEIQENNSNLRLAPNHVAMLYRQACLFCLMARDEEARTFWQKVIDLDDESWAKSARKMLRKKLGDST